MTVVDLFAGLGGWGATGRHPSYGLVCVLPAGHQPPPGQPPTSTAGWHRSADGKAVA